MTATDAPALAAFSREVDSIPSLRPSAAAFLAMTAMSSRTHPATTASRSSAVASPSAMSRMSA